MSTDSTHTTGGEEVEADAPCSGPRTGRRTRRSNRRSVPRYNSGSSLTNCPDNGRIQDQSAMSIQPDSALPALGSETFRSPDSTGRLPTSNVISCYGIKTGTVSDQPDYRTTGTDNPNQDSKGIVIPTVFQRIDGGGAYTAQGPHTAVTPSACSTYDESSASRRELHRDDSQHSATVTLQCAADKLQVYRGSQVVVSPVKLQTQDKILHFLGPIVVAVYVTLCCCGCFGAIALYIAVLAKRQSARGDTEEAMLNAQKSYHWSFIGFLIGLTILAVGIVYYFRAPTISHI